MNNQVFNTEFEVSLRILCILANTNEELSFEQLLYFDFISTYAKEFGFAKYNIQGDSNYKITEKGLSFNMKMNDEYFYHLKTLILKIVETYGNKPEQEIYKEISEKIRR